LKASGNSFIYLLIDTEQRTTAQGQVYYFHAQSGVSSWHDPRVPRSVLTYYRFLQYYESGLWAFHDLLLPLKLC